MVSLRAIEPARAGTRAIGTRKTLGPGRGPKPSPTRPASHMCHAWCPVGWGSGDTGGRGGGHFGVTGIWVGGSVLSVYGRASRASLRRPADNSIGGDRFRLRWLIQVKRAEGCGCDLVNHATVNE